MSSIVEQILAEPRPAPDAHIRYGVHHLLEAALHFQQAAVEFGDRRSRKVKLLNTLAGELLRMHRGITCQTQSVTPEKAAQLLSRGGA